MLNQVTPNTFYWVSSGPGSLKHLYIIAYASGVQGPLLADVYYPINTLSSYLANATTIGIGSRVSKYGIAASPDEYQENCSPPPAGVTFVEAIHLGNQCKPHGINWTYTATAPANGAGVIEIAQLVNFSATYWKGVASESYNFYNTFQLDGSFPYSDQADGSGGTASIRGGGSAKLRLLFDAPASILAGLTCTQASRADSFADYFMYRPNATKRRPSIPVTIALLSWTWGGTAATTNSGKTWVASGLVSPPTTIESTASTQLPFYLANNQALLDAIPSDPCSEL
jgi:hypothetical protein